MREIYELDNPETNLVIIYQDGKLCRRFELRLTEKDYHRIKAEAARSHESMSEFIRSKLWIIRDP